MVIFVLGNYAGILEFYNQWFPSTAEEGLNLDDLVGALPNLHPQRDPEEESEDGLL